MHMLSTHLESQYTKHIHVTGRHSSSVGQLEALRVNQLGGSPMEEPIDFYPWNGAWNGGRSKVGDPDTSISVDEDISLDKREWVVSGVV